MPREVIGAPPHPPLVQALLDPSVYPDGHGNVELIETHISWVFLVGERVYKVKKPVALGFLDFTTLDRRRAACEDEVRLNRRLAPDVYDGVVELRGTPERPRFGGAGPPRGRLKHPPAPPPRRRRAPTRAVSRLRSLPSYQRRDSGNPVGDT